MHAGLAFFFFIDTATTEIYTLSLHDALPIYLASRASGPGSQALKFTCVPRESSGPRSDHDDVCGCRVPSGDRKSTRLNSSHPSISYAVFCLKKKRPDDPSGGSAERGTSTRIM